LIRNIEMTAKTANPKMLLSMILSS
jgi:hypothetical protein